MTDNGEDPSGKGRPVAHKCLNKFSGEVRGRPQIQPCTERGSWSKELGLALTRTAELVDRRPPRPWVRTRSGLTPWLPDTRAGSQRSREQRAHRRTLAKACVEPGPAGSRSPKGTPDTSPGGRPSKPAAPGAHPGTRRGQARAPGTLRASQPPGRGGGAVGWGGRGFPESVSPLPSKVPGTQVLGSGAGWTIAQSPQSVPGPRHPEATRAVTSAREASELHSPGLPAPSSGGRSAGPLRRARGSSEGGREGGSWAGGWPECTE